MSRLIFRVLLILNILMALWVAIDWYLQDQTDGINTQIMYERSLACGHCRI